MIQRSPERSLLKCSFLLLFFLGVGSVYAQQDPQFTQYMYNRMYFNPAFAGKSGEFEFSALHRSQWAGYSTTSGSGGAPTTQLLTAQGALESKGIGYGLTIVNDNIGASNNLEINLQGAYHRRVRRATLSFGAYLGMYSSTLDYGELVVVNPEPNLPGEGRESQLNFNVGAGLLWDAPNYYIGLSSRHINQPSFDFGDGAYANTLENHTYLLAGYRFRPVGSLLIEPSFLLKSVSFNNFSYELSVIATHQNKISGGLGFRGEESVSLLVGYSLLRDNSLKLGYAFDLVFSGVEAKEPTSHELLLRYTLPSVTRDIQRVIQRTPRFRF